MFKKLSLFLYKIIFYLDKIFFYIFKRSILVYFNDFIQIDSYKKLKILNKDANFFVPNQITNWRVDTLFTKEPETLEWIDGFNESNKIIFWDIGANIGLYSIYAALRHKNIEVISFEPSTNNLRVLSRNISINNLEEKIKINQFPLSDKVNEYAIMNESEFIEGWATSAFGKSNHKNDSEEKKLIAKQKYKIFGTSINFLLDNKILNIPNYIKIDVDGIEHIILKGADKYLDNENIKSISIELDENFKEQFDSVLEIMSNKKFKFKHKKRADSFYKNDKFSKIFNYVFIR